MKQTGQTTATWIALLLMGLFFCPAIQAQEEETKKESFSVSARKLRTEHRRAISKLKRKFKDAETDEDRDTIVVERREFEMEMANRAIKLTDDSDDPEESIELLSWIVKSSKAKAKMAAGQALMSAFSESEHLGVFADSIAKSTSPSKIDEGFLRTMKDKSPHVDVQGKSAWALVQYVTSLQDEVVGNKTMIALLAKSMGTEDAKEYLESWTDERCEKELKMLMAECTEKYSDVKIGTGTIGQLVRRQEIQANLQIGKVAPDITGKDFDEVDFKLSDYRGKVVVIDFWGDW